MRTIKRALVATTDGSARSFNVLPHAARFAEAANLEFHVLYVLDDAVERAAFPRELEVRVARRANKVRATIARELKAIDAKAAITIRVKRPRQRVWEAVLEGAVALGAVTLAMNSRGDNFLRTAVLGSTALRVLAASHMPILMTSSLTDPPPVRAHRLRVLACIDGSASSDALGSALTATFLEADVAVSILRFSEEDGEPVVPSAARAATQFARWFPPNISVRHIRRPANAVSLLGIGTAILAVADHENSDVVALATRGHRLRHRILSDSVGIAVLSESNLPVLLRGRH